MIRWRPYLLAVPVVAVTGVLGAWWNQIIGSSDALRNANWAWHNSGGGQFQLGVNRRGAWFGVAIGKLFTTEGWWHRVGGAQVPDIESLSFLDRMLLVWSGTIWLPASFDNADHVFEAGVGLPFSCVVVTDYMVGNVETIERRVWWLGAVLDVVVIGAGFDWLGRWASRRKRRHQAGLCSRCGYPVSAGKCPECGFESAGEQAIKA